MGNVLLQKLKRVFLNIVEVFSKTQLEIIFWLLFFNFMYLNGCG